MKVHISLTENYNAKKLWLLIGDEGKWVAGAWCFHWDEHFQILLKVMRRMSVIFLLGVSDWWALVMWIDMGPKLSDPPHDHTLIGVMSLPEFFIVWFEDLEVFIQVAWLIFD